MKTTLSILTVLTAGLLAATANADGLPVTGVDAPPGGVGGDVGYVAVPDEGHTFVQRTERSTGTLLGSRILTGRFEIPVVAYDGSAGGLSADGNTLVLIATSALPACTDEVRRARDPWPDVAKDDHVAR
jgi:hypothetical protein